MAFCRHQALAIGPSSISLDYSMKRNCSTSRTSCFVSFVKSLLSTPAARPLDVLLVLFLMTTDYDLSNLITHLLICRGGVYDLDVIGHVTLRIAAQRT